MNVTAESFPHVVIVGGGITGLAAGYYLQKAAQKTGMPLRYSLLESSSRLGGKLRSDVISGLGDEPFIVEGGPDCFLTQKPWAMNLAQELGIGEQLMGTNDSQRKVFVLNRGRPTPLPDGVLLIVPTKFTPFAMSPLISPWGKLRMGMDLFIRAKRDDEDETLSDFITRRLGSEALDKIAEPLLSGIYNAEADRQSVLATFPRFRAIEKEHGSLIKGMLAVRKARAATPPPAPSDAPASMFVTFRDGTETLATELASRLTGDVELNLSVQTVSTRADGRFALRVGGPDESQTIVADAVLLTTPAYVSADMLNTTAYEAAAILRQIRYVSTGTISLAFRADDMPPAVSGFGLVIPQSAHRPINAVTFSSTKFDHRAPEGYYLLRVFFGGSRSPQSMQLADDELEQMVRGQLRDIFDIRAEPLFHRTYRWQRANPQYDVNHLDRVEEIERLLPAGIVVAGSAYRGVGIPDCVHQAQLAVERLLQHIPTPQAAGGAA